MFAVVTAGAVCWAMRPRPPWFARIVAVTLHSSGQFAVRFVMLLLAGMLGLAHVFGLDTLLLLPVFLLLFLLFLLFLLVRGVPAYLPAPRDLTGRAPRAALGLFASTCLPLVVAITAIGLDEKVIGEAW